MIEKLYDLDNLIKSFNAVRKISGWKGQTQKYEEDYISKIVKLRERLISGEYKPTKPNMFVLNERGKIRLIESYCIEDRIVQGCLVNDILMPQCRPYLIYDNSASLKDRGTDFFRRRLEKNIRSFARLNGNDGYILLIDYKKFFDNIWHDTFIKALQHCCVDEDTISFVKTILSQHEVDVSYMSDEEYANCMNIPYDALVYKDTILKEQQTGQKFMRKSFGIGSQIAQVAGIVSPYMIDNYVKIVRGCKYYARYMDDSYIIHKDKEFLKDMLLQISEISKENGFIINTKKTQIVNLKHKFTLLKTQYQICDNGELIKIPDNSTFKRERRKIKAMSKRGVGEEVSLSQFKSWRGAIVSRYGEYKSIRSIDEYYNKHYGKRTN